MKISKTMKDLIHEAIKVKKTTDRYILCEYVAAKIEELYFCKSVYQLKKQGAEKTGKILDMIDTYLSGDDFETVIKRKAEIQKLIRV